MKLKDLFNIEYGTKFDLNKMTFNNPSIAFVSRTNKNNGVTAIVDAIDNKEAYRQGLITVSLGGTVLSSHVQDKEFYTGQNVAVLESIIKINTLIKLFYCKYIEENKFRYSACGREANRTLKDIEVPDLVEAMNILITWGFVHSLGGAELSMMKLSDLFYIEYGTNLELNKLKEVCDGINFVSRTFKNNGVSAKVCQLDNIKPNNENTISIACSGTVLEAFLHDSLYYSGRDVYILTPKQKLTTTELLFYCMCIKSNKYKYSFGRQANKTLKDIEVPVLEELPLWLDEVELPDYSECKKPYYKKDKGYKLKINDWVDFKLSELFNITKGGSKKENFGEELEVPLVTSSSMNNGVSEYILTKNGYLGNKLTVSGNGRSCDCFYQPYYFDATADVNILSNINLNIYSGLFISAVLNMEQFRFSYGRKFNQGRILDTHIKLPVTKNGNPDYKFMEEYIKCLSYSKYLGDI